MFKAAWFVSHCATQGRRERYARLMKLSMAVDIYGRCGPFKCDRGEDEQKCFANMAKDYRFYLSFENSICDDYITEKFFNILKLVTLLKITIQNDELDIPNTVVLCHEI